jgi:nucleotide-binding universal stress UspA family protein
MQTRSNVICAVDLSARAGRVADLSRRLAERLDARVVVTHVFDPMAVPTPPTAELHHLLTSDEIEDHHRKLAVRALIAIAAERFGDVEHETVFAEGDPRSEIERLVGEYEARLLITGSAARRPLDRLMQGSLSGELAVSAPCPVVVLTDDAHLDDDGPVVAAYDGSDHSLLAARHAAALAAGLGRELVMVHVTDSDEAGVRADADLASELHEAARSSTSTLGKSVALDVTVAVEHGDPVEQFMRVARDRAAALVVVGSRGRNALKAALLGSVSAGVVRSADRPVVVAGPASEAALVGSRR